MILYLDTSALVPLVKDEPSTGLCVALRRRADKVFTTRIAYVEATAALGMARRMGRIDDSALTSSRSALNQLWGNINVIEVGAALVDSAAGMAIRHGLRGYDAVHCAAAVVLADNEGLIAATGDAKLLDAWMDMGLDTADTADIRNY